MTSRYSKSKDVFTINEFEKIAVKKGLVIEDNKILQSIDKNASAKKNLLPTNNLLCDIVKLCDGLKAKGLHSFANEIEENFINFKKANTIYETSKETGEDVINFAHPKGSHKLEGVAGDAVVRTVLDKHLIMLDVANKPAKVSKAQSSEKINYNDLNKIVSTMESKLEQILSVNYKAKIANLNTQQKKEVEEFCAKLTQDYQALTTALQKIKDASNYTKETVYLIPAQNVSKLFSGTSLEQRFNVSSAAQLNDIASRFNAFYDSNTKAIDNWLGVGKKATLDLINSVKMVLSQDVNKSKIEQEIFNIESQITKKMNEIKDIMRKVRVYSDPHLNFSLDTYEKNIVFSASKSLVSLEDMELIQSQIDKLSSRLKDGIMWIGGLNKDTMKQVEVGLNKMSRLIVESMSLRESIIQKRRYEIVGNDSGDQNLFDTTTEQDDEAKKEEEEFTKTQQVPQRLAGTLFSKFSGQWSSLIKNINDTINFINTSTLLPEDKTNGVNHLSQLRAKADVVGNDYNDMSKNLSPNDQAFSAFISRLSSVLSELNNFKTAWGLPK